MPIRRDDFVHVQNINDMKKISTHTHGYLKRWVTLSLSALLILGGFQQCVLPSQKSSAHHAKPDPAQQSYVTSSLQHITLIKAANQVDKNLLKFLQLFDIPNDGTLEGINEAMQAHFLRKPTQELRDMAPAVVAPDVEDQAYALLRAMGFMDEIPHTAVDADYFLLFGAFTTRKKTRFRDFLDQYEQEILRCRQLVLLGGIRYLREDEIADMQETLEKAGSSLPTFLQARHKWAAFQQQLAQLRYDAQWLAALQYVPEQVQALSLVGLTELLIQHKKLPTALAHAKVLTETDAWYHLWEAYAPDLLKAAFQEGHNLIFVNDLKIGSEGVQRPNTKTTIEAWYYTYRPQPGHIHANVEKPYAIRMEKALRTFLEGLPPAERGFSITWNSPAAHTQLDLAVYKDQLARTFYQELLLRKAIASAVPQKGRKL